MKYLSLKKNEFLLSVLLDFIEGDKAKKVIE
jgi:hypothetical protein